MSRRNADLNDMMLFVAIVDAGSFTLAADRLDIPKANLSRRFARLEQQLGVTLIERTTRRHQLTESGKSYLTFCREIAQQVDLAESAIAEQQNIVQGQIKVGASVGIGQEILQPALGNFLHQFPELSLDLRLTNQRVDLIAEGYDLLIRIGELEDSRLMAKKLGSITRHLYASRGYLAECGHPTSPEALKDHTWLNMSSSIPNKQISLSNSRGEHCSAFVDNKFQVDDFQILRQLLIDGVGIAAMPDYFCDYFSKHAVANHQLDRVLPDWHLPAVDAYLVYPKHRLGIAKVQAFYDFVVPLFQQRLG